MPARPSESPIDVSSNSPTPTRPRSLPRRSSSRIREIHEAIDAPLPHTGARQAAPEADVPVMPVPPPPQRETYVSLPPTSHRPVIARHGLAIPSATPIAGPSRAGDVIDLTEDDDDDIEFTGEVPVAATRRVAVDPRPNQRPRVADIRARIAAENERYRNIGRQGRGQDEAYAPYDVNAWRDLNREFPLNVSWVRLTCRNRSSSRGSSQSY